MSSLFREAMAAADAVIDDTFGERFFIEPHAAPRLSSGRPDVNASPVADALRPVTSFVGVFVAPGASVQPRGRGMPADTVRGIVAETPMIDVDVAALLTPLKRGDIILREDTGEYYEITDPLRPVNFGRGLIALVPRPYGTGS